MDIVAVALREIDGECSLTVATLDRDSWAVHAHVSISVHACSLRGCALCSPGAQRQGGHRAAPQEIRCRVEGSEGVKAVGFDPTLKSRKVLVLSDCFSIQHKSDRQQMSQNAEVFERWNHILQINSAVPQKARWNSITFPSPCCHLFFSE